MKTIIILLITSITAFSLYAQEGEQSNTVGLIAPTGPEYYGQRITEKGSVKPPQFLKSMEGKNEMDLKLEAKIVTCCKKKGCWMDVDLENGNTMKVTFKDYEFFVPKNADGRIVIMEGKAKLETTDVATLQHYAEDAGKSKEEIAAITQPKKAYTFEAIGVIIK